MLKFASLTKVDLKFKEVLYTWALIYKTMFYWNSAPAKYCLRMWLEKENE